MAMTRNNVKSAMNFNICCLALTAAVSFLLHRENEVGTFKFIWALMFLWAVGRLFYEVLSYNSELERFDEMNPQPEHCERFNHLSVVGVKEVKPFVPNAATEAAEKLKTMTPDEVAKLLAEGRELRKELEKDLRNMRDDSKSRHERCK